MKIFKKLLLFFIAAAFIAGCSDEPTESQYELIGEKTPAAVITSITPETAVAGGDTITIVGQNFSSKNEENWVYFYQDARSMAVYSTPTMIKVVAPSSIIQDIDSAKIKVSVTTSRVFSNEFIYKKLYAPKTLISLDKGENAASLTVNGLDELFVGISNTPPAKKYTIKIANGTITTNYGNAGNFQDWSDIDVGPDDKIYGVTKDKAGIYTFAQTPNSSAATFSGITGMPTGKGLLFVEFDEFGNLWTGGFDHLQNIYHFTPTKTMTTFPVNKGRIVDAKFYSGKIYIVVVNDTTDDSKIYRADYNATGITGAYEEYYNFSSYMPETRMNCIAFSESGKLYMGTSGKFGLYYITKSNEAPRPLYSGAFSSRINKIEWGKGNYLYVIQENLTLDEAKDVRRFLYKVPMTEKGI